MRSRSRFAPLVGAVLLTLASASPALASRSEESEATKLRIQVVSIWEWLTGFLAPLTDASRGEIIPGDPGTGGENPVQSPDGTPTYASPDSAGAGQIPE